MNVFRNFLSHLLLVTVIVTQLSPYSFAEDGAILHSLDELPSSQIEEKTSITYTEKEQEEAITLLAAKSEYEKTQNTPSPSINLPSLSALLEQNALLWGTHDTGFMLPIEQTIIPTQVETFFPAGNFFHPQSHGVFKSGKEKKFEVPTQTELGDDTTGKFSKNPTNIKLSAGTSVRAANGDMIDPSIIGVYEADATTQKKANTYHDQKRKNKGNTKK